jgi:hypothetical protein
VTATLRGGLYDGHTITPAPGRPLIVVTVHDDAVHVLDTAPRDVIDATAGSWRAYKLAAATGTTSPVYEPLTASR